MSNDNTLPKNRIKELDTLRGIACLIVLIAHAIPFYDAKWDMGIYSHAIFGMGKLAVALFFVMSAYLLTRIYFKSEVGVGEFVVRRLVRVYIPYAAAATFGWLIEWLATKDDWISVLDFSSVIDHFWTIPVELKFYFFFAIMLCGVKWLKINKPVLIGALIIGSIVQVIIFKPSSWIPNDPGFEWYFSIFALAIIIGLIQEKIDERLVEVDRRIQKTISVVSTLIGVLLIIAFIMALQERLVTK